MQSGPTKPSESPTTPPGKLRRFAIAGMVYGGIIVVTLILFDLALIALGLFPPQYIPGDADLGWVGAPATGEMTSSPCFDFEAEVLVELQRNEYGLRTSYSTTELSSNPDLLKVAVSGDSQTELCAPNEETHFGVVERELTAAGHSAAVFSGSAGKYSPLQAYLSVKRYFSEYSPQVLVINYYTGNDFYDMLRVDDRPHFVQDESGYHIADPIWYRENPPGKTSRSRVLFVMRSIAQRTGLSNLWIRVRYLRDVAAEQGEGIGTVIRYMNDLRNALSPDVGYSAAFAAQMLNQQIFFHRFPNSQEESLRRTKALLELVRAENPDLLLILSPLPSYHLVPENPVAPAFMSLFEKLPMTFEEGQAEELYLYESLRQLAAESGWEFVDNLALLREYSGADRLYNSYDYHLTTAASELIGKAQAAIVLSQFSSSPPVP